MTAISALAGASRHCNALQSALQRENTNKTRVLQSGAIAPATTACNVGSIGACSIAVTELLIVVWSGTLERQGKCPGLSSPHLGPNSSTARAMKALPLAAIALR